MNDRPLSPNARRALEVFREQTAAPLAPARRSALWRAAIADTRRASNQWGFKAFVLAVSCLVGAVAVTRMLGARQPEVQAAQAARWHREGDSVTVERGRLRLHPKQRLAVVTPQLQAVVQNAVALFDVSSGATLLVVESGEVAWRTARKSGVLRAGEQLTVKAHPPTPPPALTVASGVPAVDSCAEGPAYGACLAREAEGAGLAAQTALFALGMLAHERGALGEAVEWFRTYGERFPNGVFAPEASIALMVDFQQDGKLEEARAEAARFGSRFADEPRAEDVARWSEQLR